VSWLLVSIALPRRNEGRMGKEIERKFLVTGNDYRSANSQPLRQGYLNREKPRTVRVRTVGRHGFLTIKGISVGPTRDEFEYPIPLADANQLLDSLCERPLIEKRRYVINYVGKTWEIDEFSGENAGLVIAEVELSDEREVFEKPPWVGEEVTHDARYLNANLVKHPFCHWSADDPSKSSNLHDSSGTVGTD
jgi:adenylate cyclase